MWFWEWCATFRIAGIPVAGLVLYVALPGALLLTAVSGALWCGLDARSE